MWNYRVIQHKTFVGLHECYYKKGRKKPYMWSEEPEVTAEDLHELLSILRTMHNDAMRHLLRQGMSEDSLKILKVENMPGALGKFEEKRMEKED